MRTSATAVLREDLLKVNGPVEVQAAVVEDVDPVRLEISGRVEDGDLHNSTQLVIQDIPQTTCPTRNKPNKKKTRG